MLLSPTVLLNISSFVRLVPTSPASISTCILLVLTGLSVLSQREYYGVPGVRTLLYSRHPCNDPSFDLRSAGDAPSMVIQITKHDDVFMLDGEGMPTVGNPFVKGRLFIIFKVGHPC